MINYKDTISSVQNELKYANVLLIFTFTLLKKVLFTNTIKQNALKKGL